MDWRQIEGWFSEGDNALNLKLAEIVRDGIVVTLGVHKGRSTRALADAFRAAGTLESVTLVGIDYFYKDTLPIAAANLVDVPLLRLWKGDTVRAADDFRDGSVAAVFDDAGHDYDTTRATIAAWLPKLRDGGIFCGHDYMAAWPGVVRAVDEAFPEGVILFHTAWMRRPTEA